MPRPHQRRRSRHLDFDGLEARDLLTAGITVLPGPNIITEAGIALPLTPLASFVVTDPTTPSGDQRRARVSWGDGATTKQVVPTAMPDGSFYIQGVHEYDQPGDYLVVITVAVPGNPDTKNTVGIWAHVGGVAKTPPPPAPPALPPPPALTVTGRDVFAPPSRVVRAPLATARVGLPDVSPTDATVTINWGDRKRSRGQVMTQPDGTWIISGRHRYRSPGRYMATIVIVRGNGEMFTTESLVVVRRARWRR